MWFGVGAAPRSSRTDRRSRPVSRETGRLRGVPGGRGCRQLGLPWTRWAAQCGWCRASAGAVVESSTMSLGAAGRCRLLSGELCPDSSRWLSTESCLDARPDAQSRVASGPPRDTPHGCGIAASRGRPAGPGPFIMSSARTAQAPDRVPPAVPHLRVHRGRQDATRPSRHPSEDADRGAMASDDSTVLGTRAHGRCESLSGRQPRIPLLCRCGTSAQTHLRGSNPPSTRILGPGTGRSLPARTPLDPRARSPPLRRAANAVATSTRAEKPSAGPRRAAVHPPAGLSRRHGAGARVCTSQPLALTATSIGRTADRPPLVVGRRRPLAWSPSWRRIGSASSARSPPRHRAAGTASRPKSAR